jgi:hypothetical protein
VAYPLPDWFRAKAKAGEAFTAEDRDKLIAWFAQQGQPTGPEANSPSQPVSAGGVTHKVMLHVADVDRHFAQAVENGARVLLAPETHPFGERQCTVEDPGGHQWTLSETVADVAPEDWGGELVNPGAAART